MINDQQRKHFDKRPTKKTLAVNHQTSLNVCREVKI